MPNKKPVIRLADNKLPNIPKEARNLVNQGFWSLYELVPVEDNVAYVIDNNVGQCPCHGDAERVEYFLDEQGNVLDVKHKT